MLRFTRYFLCENMDNSLTVLQIHYRDFQNYYEHKMVHWCNFCFLVHIVLIVYIRNIRSAVW